MPITEEMRGHTFNGSGKTIDGAPPVFAGEYLDIQGWPIKLSSHNYRKEMIQTRVSAIDAMTSARGQTPRCSLLLWGMWLVVGFAIFLFPASVAVIGSPPYSHPQNEVLAPNVLCISTRLIAVAPPLPHTQKHMVLVFEPATDFFVSFSQLTT